MTAFLLFFTRLCHTFMYLCRLYIISTSKARPSMHYTLRAPDHIDTVIQLPSSKSISNRVLIMNQLSGSKMQLDNLSDCDDTRVMLKALNNRSEITDIHAAGTAMRFLTAYYASTDNRTILTGTERMKHRPISILVETLQGLGADIQYMDKKGFPPLRISGRRLAGGETTLPGNVSSQYISALMMIAPYMENGLKIHIEGDIISQSYIVLTMELMKLFGAKISQEGDRTLNIQPSTYTGGAFTVESDWSAASYWYEIVALAPGSDHSVELPHLHHDSLQGDSQVSRLFEPLGVRTTYRDNAVRLSKGGARCETYEADLSNQPDLAQTIVVTCAMLKIPFHITGLQTLRIKETDRIKALVTELRKLGVNLQKKNGDTLIWNGKTETPEASPMIDTYEDHRMAMAFAPCAFSHERLSINNPEVVSKSYPHFWKDLLHAGFTILNE